MEKLNIKNLSLRELADAIDDLGEKRHRRAQILKWLYRKGAADFAAMTDLPKELRRTLDERFTITSLRAAGSVTSSEDMSQKFLFEAADGALIETVLMETQGHLTICVSSQVGCPLGCTLCSTGAGGFERDLRCDEILNQILQARDGSVPPRTRYNLVFMGMGEPLLNQGNVVRALETLNASDAFALGEKRITVSTVGIPETIRELAASALKFGLAISLNATTDETRRRLMPAAHGLIETLSAASEFAEKRKTRVTLEYVLLAGVNDSEEDARRLANLTAGKRYKINLIPFNEWEGCPYRRPSDKAIEAFIRPLLPRAPAVTVRRSQGRDIAAACGQLRMKRRK